MARFGDVTIQLVARCESRAAHLAGDRRCRGLGGGRDGRGHWQGRFFYRHLINQIRVQLAATRNAEIKRARAVGAVWIAANRGERNHTVETRAETKAERAAADNEQMIVDLGN
jgi:hypothetical protein